MTLASITTALRLNDAPVTLEKGTELRNLKILQVVGWGTVTFFEARILSGYRRLTWHTFYINGRLAIEE